MGAIDLVLAAHNHQPAGNFDHVIEDAYQRAYRPFLEVLDRHPGVRFSLHQPGLLWEWLTAHHPEYLEDVQRLVARGQMELISGGYYEPILPVIPPRDRYGQITKLNAWIEQRFGTHPRGAWLAERVWEPHLAETLRESGLEFTILDDSHFKSAGIPEHQLDGYWLTEENGHVVRVFPISQKLRYLIPFAAPEASIEYLRAASEAPSRAAAPVLVLADDGEKFGVWSATHALCYEQGWLERFFTALEANSDWLRTRTFSEVLDRTAPRGRTYLPTASYAEMMEWALPPAAQRALHQALEQVGTAPAATDLKIFVRGGFWRNFLAKYPEANWMHKRMLDTSRRVAAYAERCGDDHSTVRRAREALWKGQCNCAYWHGLFGGLYLPHLRSAIYRQLLEAEAALESIEPLPPFEVFDLDADGELEIVLRSAAVQAIVKPSEGGAVFELDHRRAFFNVLDTMARREEAYHDKLRALDAQGPDAAPTVDAGGGAVSIHDMVAVKEPGLENKLFYDAYRPGSCVDHALAIETRFDQFVESALPELAELAGTAYPWTRTGDSILLERTTPLLVAGTPRLRLSKRIQVTGPALECAYELRLDGSEPAEFLFAVEMTANFQAGDAPDRYFELPDGGLEDRRLVSTGVLDNVTRIDLVDEWLGLRTRLESTVPARLWRRPIETVSNSESGFECVYQGSVMLFLWQLHLDPGARWSTRLTQALETR